MNICDFCGKEMEKFFGVNDEILCESCFNDLVTQAEYAYESYREAEATGN